MPKVAKREIAMTGTDMTSGQHIGACIDRETLSRYVHGQILSTESSAVSLHLASCERCVLECESLSAGDDQFEAELKRIGKHREWQISPGCALMLERIRQARRYPSSKSAIIQAVFSQDDTKSLRNESTASDLDERVIQPSPQFGRYTIVRHLGAGGMASVYQALDNRLNRQVALKLPHRSIQADPAVRARFQQEGNAAAAVNHPHVCGVLDIGEFEGLCYLTMPLLEGESLAQRLKRDPPLELAAALQIMCGLCDAVDAIHARDVIHRDIKPANIFLASDGRAVLMDFGIALANKGDDRLTRTGLLMGTPAYFSPEQASGAWNQVGPAADIYALGVVLYELLYGRAPFNGTPGVIIGNILHQAPPKLVSQYPDCDQRLTEICDRAMAKQPTERFANGASFRVAIQDWLASRVGSRVTPRNSSGRWRIMIVGVIALATILACITFKFKSRWGEVEITIRSPQPDDATLAQLSQTVVVPQSPSPVRRDSLAALDPNRIASDHHRALPELVRLPLGMKWVACLGPEQLSIAGDGKPPPKIQMATVCGDGTKLALMHEGPIVTIWDLLTLTRKSVFSLPKNDRTFTLSVDGSLLLTAGGGWRIRVWDLERSLEVASLSGHTNWINTLAIDGEGQRAASSSKDGTVRCWDVRRQVLLWTKPHGSWTRSIAIDDSGAHVVSGGNDGFVKFWNGETGEALGGFKAFSRPLVDLKIAKGRKLLSTLDIDGNLSVWELLDNRRRWNVETRPLQSIRFSPDGDRIACTAKSGSLVVLNTESGRPEMMIPNSTVERSWMVVGFSSDDRHMILRNADGYICLLQY